MVTNGSTKTRRAGYRLLGPAFDYLLHFRPAEWPIMAAHTALGYLLAVGLRGARAGEALAPAVVGVLIWVVLLNGGTLAINSAFDRDEGDVAYLRRPPPPPRHLFVVGLAAMAFGFGLSFALAAPYRAAFATCLVMSLLYSVPPVRLKAVPGADWVINMVGFGTLTPFAGWAATGRSLDTPHALVLLAFCPLFAALYPLTQLYQIDEDRRRGDRTLAVRLGVARSLEVATLAAAAAFVIFVTAARASGLRGLIRWAALLIAAAAWATLLLTWRFGGAVRHPADHQRRMYWALAVWALTDAAVLVAWAA